MSSKVTVILFVISFCLFKVGTNAKDNKDFAVVSTSPSPPFVEKLDSRLAKMENMLELVTTEIKKCQAPNNHEDKMSLQIENAFKNLEEKIRVTSGAKNSQVELIHPKESLPQNCKEIQQTSTNVSGIYLIQPEISADPFMVACDMATKGGGWTVFLNRVDGSQDFYLDWVNYKKGFGNLAAEFWLGLENLYYLTGKKVNELLVELVDWDSKTVYAHYDFFSIESEQEGYALKVLGGYSGDAEDSFKYQGGSRFSTKDKDLDSHNGNCAAYHTGAWWYKACTYSHLTGKYMKGSVPEVKKDKIMYWDGFHGSTYSLKEARMMIRPRDSTSSPLHFHKK